MRQKKQRNEYEDAYHKNKKVYCKYCYKKQNIKPKDDLWVCSYCDAGLDKRED
jgi:ribosomal protein L37AE/L43A